MLVLKSTSNFYNYLVIWYFRDCKNLHLFLCVHHKCSNFAVSNFLINLGYMIKLRDVSILGLIGFVQFMVLSPTFHWRYSIFVCYSCFCLGYVFYKIGCDADPFWTIGRKLLYWSPIVIVILLNIGYFFIDNFSLVSLLSADTTILFLGQLVLALLRYMHLPIGKMEIAAYGVMMLVLFFSNQVNTWF